jgi:hypothetical protein
MGIVCCNTYKNQPTNAKSGSILSLAAFLVDYDVLDPGMGDSTIPPFNLNTEDANLLFILSFVLFADSLR